MWLLRNTSQWSFRKCHIFLLFIMVVLFKLNVALVTATIELVSLTIMRVTNAQSDRN